MLRILSIVLLFTYCGVRLGGYLKEDGFLHVGISGECNLTGEQEEPLATNSSDFSERNRVSGTKDKEIVNPPLNSTVITFGSFDLFHVGHVHILRRAKQLGKKLIVGICTDAATQRKKGRLPVYSEEQRRDIVEAIGYVDHVFIASKSKRDHILEYNSDILVMGDDHEGAYDSLGDICHVVYLPRTKGVSTTEVIEKVAQNSADSPPTRP